MKRIFSLFSLLLSVIIGYAQIPNSQAMSSEQISTGYYYIASTEATAYGIESPYIADVDGNMNLVPQSQVSTNLSTSKKGVWLIENLGSKSYSADGTFIAYRITSLETKKHWSAGIPIPMNYNGDTSGTIPYYRITYNAEGGYYTFAGTSLGNMGNHQTVNAESATSFKRNDNGAYNHWRIIALPSKNITVNFTDENQCTFSKTYDNVTISNSFTPTLNFYKNISSLTVTSDKDTYTATCENDFPFKVSTASSKAWNYLRLRKDGDAIANCYLKANSDNDQIKSRDNNIKAKGLTSLRAYHEDESCQWAFVKKEGTPYNFVIYNRAKGDDKVLNLTSEREIALTMADRATTTGFTDFYIEQQPTGSGVTITGGFTIRPNSENTHAVGDHKQGVLGYWMTRSEANELQDNGSIFRVVNITEDCKNAIPEPNALLGSIATDAKTTLTSADITTPDAFFAKYDALKASNSLVKQPTESKLYRIWFKRSNRDTKYYPYAPAQANAAGEVSIADDTRAVGFVSADDALSSAASTLVRFVPTGTEGQYYIQNVNSNFYWGTTWDSWVNANVPVNMVADVQFAGKYAIDYNAANHLTYLGLKDMTRPSGDENPYLMIDGETKITNHGYWNGEKDGFEYACMVQIEEQSTYPIAIGATGYATLCLPFSVTLPEGVTAHKVTDVTGDSKELTLESIGNTIPADEPVILQGAATDYPLTINANKGTKSSDNILTGALVKRTGITDTYYALGYKATVGFYKVSTGSMPANKAYLLKNNIPASAQAAMMFSFNFGGNITGIDHAIATEDAENNVYYDLNGRRVLYPTRGIYVKGNGKKVFIK